MAALNQAKKYRTTDALYSVTEENDGYHVFIWDVYGYTKTGDPVCVPGGHKTIIVSRSFKVLSVVGGA